MSHVVLDITCEHCNASFVGISFTLLNPNKTFSAQCPKCNKLTHFLGSVEGVNQRIPEGAVEIMYYTEYSLLGEQSKQA